MKYYIETIEQIKDSEGAISEYAKVEQKSDLNLALSAYYAKLANVAADLDKNHTYMNIKIVDSLSGVVKYDSIGDYVEE